MLSLSQRQSLLQRLSPQQVQYLKMLQLPVLALEQRIKEEIELNPLLEEATDAAADQETTDAAADQEATFDQEAAPLERRDDDEIDAGAAREEREADRDIDWDEYAAGDYDGYKAPSFTGQEQEEQDEYPQRAEESLSEQLLTQLHMQDLSDDEIALAEEIIGNIDDHGYLLRGLREIVDDLNKFVAATRAHSAAQPQVSAALGDGRFDAYEDLITDEPFGRDRLLASVIEHERADEEDGFAGDLDESVHDRHDGYVRVPSDDGRLDGADLRGGADRVDGGASMHDSAPTVDASPTSVAAEPTIATMSLEEMSRLSIEELSRLLERGTSAFTQAAAETPPPATAASMTSAADVEAVTPAPGQAENGLEIPEVFTLAEAERILRKIQRLDPPGIGSRDLRECLMVQLETQLDRSDAHALAYRLLRDAYQEFTMRHFEKIAHKLGCEMEDLREPIEVIRSLNPKPGQGSSTLVDGNYVTPDFVIERDGEDILIIPNDRGLPALRINRAYQELIRRGEGKRKDVDRDTRKFIREKFESAKWFIASIHQRRQTMSKVMRAIVDLQQEFFISGPNSIRPMIYKDVAERIEMDISTICRVVNGKYAQTDYGTFELRYFFSEKLETASGEEVSTKVVKARIQEMIEAEDKRHPLSDDAIAQEMERAGFNVARRTVAKYREQMNIPVARMRRAL